MGQNPLWRVPLQLFLDEELGRQLPIQDDLKPDESGNGYALRMTEANGIQFSQLARSMASLGHRYLPNEAAGKIAYLFGGNPIDVGKAIPKTYREKGHVFTVFKDCILTRPYHVRKSWIQVCPLCLLEAGFAQAVWELSLVTACPRHCIRLLDHCPKCFRKLTWRRPNLLECNCGKSLADSDLELASKAELWLSSTVFCHLSGARMRLEKEFPYSFLAGLSLDILLRLIRALGISRGIEPISDFKPGKLTRVLSSNEAVQVVRRAFLRISDLYEKNSGLFVSASIHMRDVEDICIHSSQAEKEKISLLFERVARLEKIHNAITNNLQIDMFYD
ncbi:TniQ protein [Advenella incenata]|uniref:TniQ protein n=1 Tax=Advenella incenata TaxID=267800 RepID=A0A4Q7V8V2_9BURK|nr:TniQ protein [Advenella incenata]